MMGITKTTVTLLGPTKRTKVELIVDTGSILTWVRSDRLRGLGFKPRREKDLHTILMIEKSSVHDHTNVDFCKRMGVCWVEVANETVSSPEAVRAICQALALSVKRLTRRGPGATKNFLDSYPQNETVVPLTH